MSFPPVTLSLPCNFCLMTPCQPLAQSPPFPPKKKHPEAVVVCRWEPVHPGLSEAEPWVSSRSHPLPLCAPSASKYPFPPLPGVQGPWTIKEGSCILTAHLPNVP